MDSAGNTDLNPPKFKWTIHGGTPQSSIVRGPGPRTNARNQTFVITSSETQFAYAYRLDNGQVVRPAGHHFISGNATFVVANLKEGNHAIQVRTASVLGIEDPTPVQQLWFVDLTPPKVHVIQRPPKKSADLEAVEAERDLYVTKLRDVERRVQTRPADESAAELALAITRILYDNGSPAAPPVTPTPRD